jgi:hypothetical protein
MTQKRSKNGVTQLAQTTIDSNSDSYIENQENPSLSTRPKAPIYIGAFLF